MALIVPLLCGGCVMQQLAVNDFYSKTVGKHVAARKTVRFQIIDAETGEAVRSPRLRVIVDQGMFSDWIYNSTGNRQGEVKIRLPKDSPEGNTVFVWANDYLKRGGTLSDRELDPVQDYYRLTPTRDERGRYVVKLFHTPGPGVGVKLPADFRGEFHHRFRNADSRADVQMILPAIPDLPRTHWIESSGFDTPSIVETRSLGEVPSVGPNATRYMLGDREIPLRRPADRTRGIAAHPIGIDEACPDHGGQCSVVYVGEAGDAADVASAFIEQAASERTETTQSRRKRPYALWVQRLRGRDSSSPDPDNPYRFW